MVATRYSKVTHHHFHLRLGEWAESSEEEQTLELIQWEKYRQELEQ